MMASQLLPGERMVRRRGNLEQGRALEMLGHAVEYLADSQLFLTDEAGVRHSREAVQILMRCSLAVFLECPEVIPVSRRLSLWVTAGVNRWARQRA